MKAATKKKSAVSAQDQAGLPAKRSEAFASLEAVMATDPRDWSLCSRSSWIYGIVFGWSEEALREVARLHNWSEESVEDLKLHRANFEFAGRAK